jgi:hypothetical protein
MAAQLADDWPALDQIAQRPAIGTNLVHVTRIAMIPVGLVADVPSQGPEGFSASGLGGAA